MSGGFKGREWGGVCYGHVAEALGALPGTTEVTWLALGCGTHLPPLGHGSLPPEEPTGLLKSHHVLGAPTSGSLL